MCFGVSGGGGSAWEGVSHMTPSLRLPTQTNQTQRYSTGHSKGCAMSKWCIKTARKDPAFTHIPSTALLCACCISGTRNGRQLSLSMYHATDLLPNFPFKVITKRLLQFVFNRNVLGLGNSELETIEAIRSIEEIGRAHV